MNCLCRQLILDQIQILRFPQDGRQQPLLCAGNAQRLTAACTIRHVDLIHLTGLERLLLFLPAVLAARPLHCSLQLGHDSCFGDVGLLSQTPRIHFLLGRVGALCQHIHSFLHVIPSRLGILCRSYWLR